MPRSYFKRGDFDRQLFLSCTLVTVHAEETPNIGRSVSGFGTPIGLTGFQDRDPVKVVGGAAMHADSGCCCLSGYGLR